MLKANAQPPTAAPTPPTRSTSDVVSLYSEAYTNVAGTDWFPNWGQSTIVTDVLAGGNPVKKYENFNYQGVQFQSAVNASSMTTLHVDIWTPNCTAFDFYLINTSPSLVEQKVTVTPTLSGWNSYDILLSQYNTVALNNIGQFKLVGTPFGSSTVYLDNIYFWKSANTPTITGFTVPAKFVGDAAFSLDAPSSNSTGAFSYSSGNTNVATISGSTVTIVGAGTSIITANQAAAGSFSSGSTTASLVVSYAPPATAAPTPTRGASSVMSLFSDAYTNVAGTDFFPNWGQSTVVSEVAIAGNATKKYEYLNYQGIQFASPLDASAMSNLHMDIYTPNCTAFDVFLINSGGVEQSVTLNPTASGWNSYDILLSQYNTVNLSNIIQFKLVGTPFGSSTVYLDNLYFWKPANAPTITGFSIPAKLVGGAPFNLSAPTSNSTGAFTYTSGNTNVATISGNTVTIVAVGSSIITANQAAAGAFGPGSTTATLVVNYPPPPTAAPTPPARNAPDVISLFSNKYTNISGIDWFPNWGQTTVVSDIYITGNTTKKYINLNYQGVQFASPIDASGMTNLHVDIFTPNCTAFDLFLINTSPGTTEQSVTLTPTLSGWNSYNINLTQYSAINLSNIGQFKLVGTPFGSSAVYLDNIYFYKNTNAPVITITQPTCSDATGTITVISGTSGLTFSIDGTTYTNTTGIFSGVSTGVYNVTSKNGLGTISSSAVAVVNSQPLVPPTPSAISGAKNINQCDTLQTYSVSAISGYTLLWTVTGSAGGNSVKSGQGTNSVVLVMKAAGTVSVKAVNSCTVKGSASTLTVVKAVPGTPGYIQQSFVPNIPANLNVCMFNQSAYAITGKPDTFRIQSVPFSTGYIWVAPAGSLVSNVNDTTITVVFADTLTVSGASPKYIRVYSRSACDTSLPSSITLTKTTVTVPALIKKSFSPNIAAVASVCGLVGGGTETYAIRKIAAANSYNWYLKRGTNANITHLNAAGANDTAITVTYGAGFTKDTIVVKAVNGCSASAEKTLIVSAVYAPPSVTAINASTGNYNACKGNAVQYTVVAPSPTAIQSVVAKYKWTIPANTSITASNADSSIITIQFSNAYTGGRLIVKGISGCGITGGADTAFLTPATPVAIVSSNGSFNACVGNTRTFTVSMPAAVAQQAVTNRFRWTLPSKVSVTSAAVDSSSITVSFLTAYAGGNMTVRGVSACSILGSTLTQVLTHTGCGIGLRNGVVAPREIVLGSEKTSVKLSPNPNKGSFNLQVETGVVENAPATIQVVDVFGRVVAQFAAANNAGTISKNVSINKLAAGIYSVKYTVGAVSNSVRMVVQ